MAIKPCNLRFDVWLSIRSITNMRIFTIALALISATFVAATTDPATLTMWFICFGVSVLLSLLNTINPKIIDGRSETIVNAFLVLSIFGCILNLDNVNNFGTVFGYAVDDERYFDKIKMFALGNVAKEIGVFEIFFGTITFIINNTFAPNFSLTTLLPLNWLFGSVVCFLCELLACRVTGQKVPEWVIYISLLLNFQFIDATIRLYREAFLYCFYVYAILLMIEKKYLKSLPFILFAGAVRGANSFFLLLFGGLNVLRGKIKNNAIFVAVIMASTLFSIIAIHQFGTLLFDYSSDISRSDRYAKAFSKYSFEDRLKLRQDSLKGGLSKSTSTHKIYSMQGIAAVLAKPAVSLFFPLTFRPLIETKISHSPYATPRIANGIFFFNILEDLMILNWIIVFPLFIIGLWHHLTCRGMKQTIAIFFITTLVLIANISGQMRHGIAFFVVIPCFVASGLFLCRVSTRTKVVACCLGLIMFLGISALNLFKVY